MWRVSDALTEAKERRGMTDLAAKFFSTADLAADFCGGVGAKQRNVCFDWASAHSGM